MQPRTIPELFLNRAHGAPNAEAVRYRKEGEWRSIEWFEFENDVREIARGMSDWVQPGDFVCILSENRPEWWMADLAILGLGAVSVPIYATNPPKDVAYILADTGARMVFVSTKAQLSKLRALREEGRIPNVDRVVLFDPIEPEADWLLDLSALRSRNPAAGDVMEARRQAIGPDDLATLIYTSGTTGEPKGVMLTHGNLVSNVMGARVVLDYIDLPERLMLSFLPLSHSLERTVGYYVAIHYGFTVAFARSIQTLVEDMGEVRPTLLVSVPRIYEKLYGRVLEQAGSGVKKRLVDWALSVGKQNAEYAMKGRSAPMTIALQNALAGRLVFSKVLEKMGGRLKFAISGGAPLSVEVAEFLAALGLTVFEGYGLTETSPIIAANRPGAVRLGTVGLPWPETEIRIAPEPGREHDGEILARGPGMMKGYYNKPEATAAVFEEGGWLHTGDIGFVDEGGFVHITDRKKELIKTSGGKYVAPQPIENALKVDPLIEQAVLVGDRRKYCIALIVPDFEALASHLGRPLPADREALNRDADVRRLFQRTIARVNEGLGSWEQIKRFHILGHELTQESGELTPSLKVKRRVIDEKFKRIIDGLYEGSELRAEA